MNVWTHKNMSWLIEFLSQPRQQEKDRKISNSCLCWKCSCCGCCIHFQPLQIAYTATVRIILTNFTTYVKIFCNRRHFYNDLDRRCKISWISHSHMKKLWPARGSNWRPLNLKSDTLPLSYGALHTRENIIVDFELGVGLKLDNFHSFMNSAMQSSVAQG